MVGHDAPSSYDARKRKSDGSVLINYFISQNMRGEGGIQRQINPVRFIVEDLPYSILSSIRTEQQEHLVEQGASQISHVVCARKR